MNEAIKIKGHYGTHTVTAVKILDGVYNLKLVDDFYRCGGFAEDPKGEEGLSFIDPSGGPFIGHGSLASKYHPELPNLKIKKLETFCNEFVGFVDDVRRAVWTFKGVDVTGVSVDRTDYFVLDGETDQWSIVDVRDDKAGGIEVRADGALERL